MNRYVTLGALALFAAGSATAANTTTASTPEYLRLTPATSVYDTSAADAPAFARERSRRVVAREVCEDVEVTERRERDGNAGGTIAGALIGGVLGNQVGSGSGRKAATVAGAVAGGYAGNRIDRNIDNGKRRTHVERDCYTTYEEPRYR